MPVPITAPIPSATKSRAFKCLVKRESAFKKVFTGTFLKEIFSFQFSLIYF